MMYEIMVFEEPGPGMFGAELADEDAAGGCCLEVEAVADSSPDDCGLVRRRGRKLLRLLGRDEMVWTFMARFWAWG